MHWRYPREGPKTSSAASGGSRLQRLRIFGWGLELGGLGGAGDGDDVAEVGHAGDEEHEALEAEAEAAVGHCAEATGVEIPPHVFHGDVELFDASHEFVVVFFAL